MSLFEENVFDSMIDICIHTYKYIDRKEIRNILLVFEP